MAKQKKKNKIEDDFTDAPVKGSMVKDLIGFIKEERFKVVLGVIAVSIAVFLTLSFIAYLFTWKSDQSKLDIPVSLFLKSADITAENWMGKSGAIVSNIFIHKWFGLASFSLVLILIVTGLRLFKIRILPLRRTIFYSLVLTFWTSIALSFFFGSKYFYLGGMHGHFLSRWLNAFWGETGTLLFLSVIIFIFIVYAIKSSLNFFKSIFEKKQREEIEDTILETIENKDTAKNKTIADTEINNLHEDINETENIEENTNEKKTEPQIYNNEEMEISTPDIETKIEKPNNNQIQDDIPLIIEQKKEEEIFEVTKPTQDEDILNETNKETNNIALEEPEITIQKKVEKKVDAALQFEITHVKTNDNPAEENVEFVVERNDETIDADSSEETPSHPELLTPFDPKLELSHYQFPSLDLLVDHKSESEVTPEELNSNKNKIVETLKNYGIDISSIKATIGPTITLYEIVPAPGVRISKIRNLEDDIALSLSALGIRIIAPMPGKGTIGIEVPNLKPEIVSMRSIISSQRFQETKFDLPIALGRTISNETFTFDLAKMPHLLVAGATGQGKSVGLNAILTSLLYKKHPSQLKFVLVDPKKVELTLYSKIERHFLAVLPGEEEAIIFDNQKVVNTLKSLCIEMDNRYNLLRLAKVRNLKEYNEKFILRRLNPDKGHKFLPYIVIIIDEFADLIMTAGKDVELPIARIAQLARAVGIHMIIATQRPSTNVITGSIKANFPARIAFKVASMIDSRTIIDCPGANQLIGKGDLLFSQGGDLIRIQCAFVDTPEVEKICDFIGSQQAYPNTFQLPEYIPEGTEGGGVENIDPSKRDEMFAEAARLIVIHQQGSTSLIQRHMSIGYNRAGRIIDQLEKAGVVGPFEGSKARKVLFSDIVALDQFLQSFQ